MALEAVLFNTLAAIFLLAIALLGKSVSCRVHNSCRSDSSVFRSPTVPLLSYAYVTFHTFLGPRTPLRWLLMQELTCQSC